MSQRFLQGALAEKARLAQTLLSDIISGIPDAILAEHQDGLRAGSLALREIYHALRSLDTDEVDREPPPASSV